ncbi:MAG: nuclear transport factor 2 family protein [Candidatus Limnocylindrales bacterium]
MPASVTSEARAGADAGLQVMMRYLEAVERWDLEAAETVTTDDLEMWWPQSGERFVGRANAVRALEAMSQKPEPAGEPRLVGHGDTWVLLMPVREGGEVDRYVGVFELAGGRVHRSTEYFGAPFPADPARAPFAARGDSQAGAGEDRPTGGSPTTDGRAVVARYLEAADRGDPEAMGALFADDMEMWWPQSGERFVGRANVMAANRARQEMPLPAGEPRIVGSGDVWVLMLPIRYADGGLFHFVGLFELAGSTIRRATGHWASPFPADPARAPFAEPT